MAKALGESARYASQEAIKQHVRIVSHCMIMISFFAMVVGACFASFVPVAALPLWLRVVFPIGALVSLLLLNKWGAEKLRHLEGLHKRWRSGTTGEVLVGNILSNFPDKFYVINDLNTGFGNIDHVVVGPTGIFVLETKNWRGVVDSDGNGELRLNGRKTDKDFVRQFVARMMHVREKVKLLAPEQDRRYHAVMVFTAARVNAKWGATGAAICIRDEQLFDYITEKKVDKPIRSDEVRRMAQAFLSLAKMDEDFVARSNEIPGVGLSA